MSGAAASAHAGTEIEIILRDAIGLDVSTVGSALVQRAAERRMRARGVHGVVRYLDLLASDESELQQLVEQVVVPETYFFREPEAIADVVARAVATQALSDVTPLRILSVPCSSGEEPYSIAMALLLAGVPANAIVIDAVDVSLEAVRRAREGVYRGGSFRGEVGEWKKYFAETEHGAVLSGDVRSRVRVSHGNLLQESFDPGRERYDAIFCRNLLIYFDANAQSRALSKLASLLAPGGVLVVGSADSFAARRSGFEPCPGFERSFLFRVAALERTPGAVAQPAHAPRTRASSIRTGQQRAIRAAAPKPAVRAAAPAQPAAPLRESGSDAQVLDQVRRLANAGQLAPAIELGERAIREGVTSAALLSLLGTTYAAVPDAERAEVCYRRALFLEPANEDALLHLALLLDQRGDSALASRFRSRARRAHSFHPGAQP